MRGCTLFKNPNAQLDHANCINMHTNTQSSKGLADCQHHHRLGRVQLSLLHREVSPLTLPLLFKAGFHVITSEPVQIPQEIRYLLEIFCI